MQNKKKQIISAFENLNADALDILLDEKRTYQDVPKSIFVNKIREFFLGLTEDQFVTCDFKDIISTITDIHTEVLMVRGKEENYNDLLRNLRKIYADNNLKSTKNLFLLDNFENQKIPQKIIEAIPNTIFWDSEKKYYYVMT